jgi:multimeric flavodoxin WrbA
MKVVGIVAGPRKTGSSARLVEEVLAGAEAAGHETHLFYMADMDIKPLGADEAGYVYPDDDFSVLMPYLESMDALVLGTPIYYDQVSARTKILIDRLYYYSTSHGAEYRRRFPDGVKFIGIFACGWDNPNVYGEVVNWLEERMSHYWNMEPIGSLKAYGAGRKPASENKELLSRAHSMGENL